MTSSSPVATAVPLHEGMSRGLIVLMAVACGLIAANLYYAQPLVGWIAPSIGLSEHAASLIVTVTQVGYCAGLVLLVPLADLLENRRLIVVTLAADVGALVLAAVAPGASLFLLAALGIGLASVVLQMMVPMAAHLSPEASRGRIVGQVMSGLLAGIMLARPVASLVADALGWRAVFGLSAAAMVLLGVVLYRLLPLRTPSNPPRYPELMRSLWVLLRDTPVLRRRAAYQAAMFAAFSLFWTAAPLLLAGPGYGLTQQGIAWFALAGVAGVLGAPISGRLADAGHTRVGTAVALAMVLAAFGIGALGAGPQGSLAALVVAGIVLDLGVQANLVLGQREIYALGAHVRARLNALYMATFFMGGAVGSALASTTLAHGGWWGVTALGAAFPLMALALFATERARS
jgi:predicted MFS family arabinose efflux permease